MMMRIPRWVLSIVLLVATAAVAQGSWAHYTNARYGYAVDYPARFSKGEAPANNDGRTFTGPDGATLSVYGMNNVMEQSLTAAYDEVLREKGKAVAYKARGRNWFVVSWREQGKVFYQKQYVGAASMCAFILAYPASSARSYDAVVSRVEKSFRPGDLSQSH